MKMSSRRRLNTAQDMLRSVKAGPVTVTLAELTSWANEGAEKFRDHAAEKSIDMVALQTQLEEHGFKPPEGTVPEDVVPLICKFFLDATTADSSEDDFESLDPGTVLKSNMYVQERHGLMLRALNRAVFANTMTIAHKGEERIAPQGVAILAHFGALGTLGVHFEYSRSVLGGVLARSPRDLDDARKSKKTHRVSCAILAYWELRTTFVITPQSLSLTS